MAVIDPAHQLVILTRLSEFCQYHGATRYHETDPWEYMRRKLLETEAPLACLKGQLFEATSSKLLRELRQGGLDNERYADFKVLFERLLAVGDFADLAIHLSVDQTPPAQKVAAVSSVLRMVKPNTLFIEERKPPEGRSPAWERLVKELTQRLDIDKLATILARKPRTRRRKSYVLRRLRRNVAEYCCVIHVPTDPTQTFTPFMLPRIEGVIAANLRFLTRYR